MDKASPILQFGTGRFLQAHVDLMVSEALAQGQALGGITVVQTTDSAQSTARLAALARPEGFPVRVRGLASGQRVDTTVQVTSVKDTLHARTQWRQLLEHFEQAQVVVSNTADAGFQRDPRDQAFDVDDPDRVPASFPAKLVALLRQRWMHRPDAPLTFMPTELVSRNGETLRDIVCAVAREWNLPPAFEDYVRRRCTWVNSLVDRIVSEPILPAGAVAEPYALWAVERQLGMQLPCIHPAIDVTDDLLTRERLKLFFLNLGHTWLADTWLHHPDPPVATVREAMAHPAFRDGLEAVWTEEVLPVFDGWGLADCAREYLGSVRERFANPFLEHALADIAQNHEQKKTRRIGPLLELAATLPHPPAMSRLRRVMPH